MQREWMLGMERVGDPDDGEPVRKGSMKGHFVRTVATVMLWMLCHMAHAGTVTYVYTDPQGTPLAEADASGNIIARFDYAPYGTAVASMSPAPNGPGYTGHVNDPDTGLVYMQARYYDPGVGRFLSVDPVTPAEGNAFNFSRYAYANNNPVMNEDPDGRQSACQTKADCEARLQMANKVVANDSKMMVHLLGGPIGSLADLVHGLFSGDHKEAAEGAANAITNAVIPEEGGVKALVSAVEEVQAVKTAATVRAENLAKEISAKDLGPSGMPKIHVVEHSSMKEAKDAARAEVGAGGTTVKHANPAVGQSHFHGVTQDGTKDRIHHEY
jgi:RHS repeat-associated protein